MKEMRAKCVHCHEEVIVSHPREFKSCKCGAIALDYGDPPYYSRICGNPEDFDEEYDKAHGIERFKSFQIEQPPLEERAVDKIFGAQIYDMNTLCPLVWGWFKEKDLHDPVMQMVKVQEEVGELAHEISRGNKEGKAVVDALGDILVTVIGMCHHLRIPPEAALSLAWSEIKDRKGKVIDGSFVKEEK